jgi:broad specificity phosphatase PhoE
MRRALEVRRHSYTKKGEDRGHGSHLSGEGVRLARRVGEAIGPFSRVVVSDVPRTLETALAMGFAVDQILPFGEGLDWEAVIAEIGWHALWEIDEPFAHVAQLLASRPHTTRLGRHYRDRWLEIAMAIGDDEAALIISHGQLMEVAVVSCLPDADHSTWGPPFSHCEGARLFVQDGAFTGVELLRIDATRAATAG